MRNDSCFSFEGQMAHLNINNNKIGIDIYVSRQNMIFR